MASIDTTNTILGSQNGIYIKSVLKYMGRLSNRNTDILQECMTGR